MPAFACPGWRRALLTTAVALVGGCTSLAPDYQRPAAPVASRFDDGTQVGMPPGGAGTAAAQLGWRQFITDPDLQRLVGIALANNRDLRVATANIEQARALYGVQRSDSFPTVSGATSVTRQKTLILDGFIYQAGLALSSFELDLFGRVRSLNEAALARYFATEQARRAVQMSLVSAVATTWISLLADGELLEITRQALATREESLKLTKLKFDTGASSEIDYRQAESLVYSARASLAQIERQQAQDRNALVLLLGQSLPGDMPKPPKLTDLKLIRDLPAGLPAEVLLIRPDVLQAEQSLIAANANIGAARAAFWPRISLTASAGVASPELSGLFDNGVFVFSIIPQLLVPIFDAGRNRANLEATEAARKIALSQYERAVQAAFREVSDGLAARRTLVDQVAEQRKQTTAETARQRLADMRYRGGAASYLDLLDAQRSLLTSQQTLIQAQAAQAQNLVTLYKALGGGWQ